MKNLPIGIEDFAVACNYYYVDKTLIIKDILDYLIGKSVLFTKPRRFGKSLTLSMIDYYFNIKERGNTYFNDKKIFQAGKKYVDAANIYPVIHINMKNLPDESPALMLDGVRGLVVECYRAFPELGDSPFLREAERKEYADLANGFNKDPWSYITAVETLSHWLYRHYQKKVVILVDEYDTPIQNAFDNGYYDEVIGYFRKFYSSFLKANKDLFFSVLTGVLEIAKESIFSDLNNLTVFPITEKDLSQYFGFTREEVQEMLDHFSLSIPVERIQEWYGGYGPLRMLNPWSVLNFVDKEVLAPYWVNTGSNNAIRAFVSQNPGLIEKLNFAIDNPEDSFFFQGAVSYRDIRADFHTFLSFLVQAGYLSASHDGEKWKAFVPNLEISSAIQREIVDRNLNNESILLAHRLKTAIEKGEADEIADLITKYVLSSFSYYDLTKEKDYQILVTGILAVLFSTHIVKSEVINRFGRCDILISPKKDKRFGAVIELKKYKGVLSEERKKQYAKNALLQIESRQYYQELQLREIERIGLYSFVFDDRGSHIEYSLVKKSEI